MSMDSTKTWVCASIRQMLPVYKLLACWIDHPIWNRKVSSSNLLNCALIKLPVDMRTVSTVSASSSLTSSNSSLWIFKTQNTYCIIMVYIYTAVLLWSNVTTIWLHADQPVIAQLVERRTVVGSCQWSLGRRFNSVLRDVVNSFILLG